MERIPQKLIDQSEEFIWEGISFPTKLNEIDKFEKNNDVSINVYYYDGEILPLRTTTTEEKDLHADLFMMTDEETGNSHFCAIKNFSRLVSSQNSKREHKIHVCKRCLFAFFSSKELTHHKINCCEFKPLKHKMPKKG